MNMSTSITDPIQPKGFRDLSINQQFEFDHWIQTITKVYKSRGFMPLRTSAVELSSVLLAKEGGETTKEIFMIPRAKHDLALRFDLTVPLARYVAANQQDIKFPFRRYQIGQSWRAENTQSGRKREFYQADIDIIGDDSIYADADVIISAIKAYQALDIEAIARINHRELLANMVRQAGGSQITEALRLIDKRDKLDKIRFGELLTGLVDDPKSITQYLDQVYQLGQLDALQESGLSQLDYLTKLGEILAREVGVGSFCFDFGLARGFDYYTGMVVEFFLPGNSTAVGSGGRYDNLISGYSSRSLGGVGCSIGVTRLFDHINPSGRGTLSEYLIAILDPEYLGYAQSVRLKVEELGGNCQIYTASSKLKHIFDYADRWAIDKLIIIGSDEIDSGQIKIKDLKTKLEETIEVKEQN